MKKLTIIVLSLSLLTTGFSSFTHKRSSPVTFYYKINAPDQRIECDVPIPGVEHSITSSSYTNVSNWTTADQGSGSYTSNDGSSYVRSFTIDDFEAVSDGDDDGQISLAEALAAINSQYIVLCSYPSPHAIVTVDANNSGGSATISAFTRYEDANIP